MTTCLDEYRHLCNIRGIVLARLMDCESFFRLWDALEIRFTRDGIREILWSVLAFSDGPRLASMLRKALEEIGEYPAEPARRAKLAMDIFLFLKAIKANPWSGSSCQLYYKSLADGRERRAIRYDSAYLTGAQPGERPCAR